MAIAGAGATAGMGGTWATPAATTWVVVWRATRTRTPSRSTSISVRLVSSSSFASSRIRSCSLNVLPGGLVFRTASGAGVFATSEPGGLLHPRGLDLLPQHREADGPDHHVVVDDVAWRAVEPERLGELHAFLQGRLDLVALEVLLQPRHVEADFLGDGKRARLVDLAAPGEQLLVEFEILLAGLVLHPHRDRDLRRFG